VKGGTFWRAPFLVLATASVAFWAESSWAQAPAAVGSTAVTSPAGRSPADKGAAESLFDQALELLRKGSLDEACSRFEQSQRIDPAVGTLLYLAECYERTGRFASAWATFREAASSAAASGQPDRAKVGTERAEKLAPKLSQVTFQLAAGAGLEGLEVSRNAQRLAPELYGVPVPVDPGEHLIRASAAGYQTWELRIQVPAQKSEQVVTVPPLTPLPTAEPAPAAPEAPAEERVVALPVASAPVEDSQSRGVAPAWIWVSAGVGVTGVGVGVVFGLVAKRHDDDAERYCNGARCFDPRGERLSEDSRRAALIANVGYGVGAAGVITAVVLSLLGGDDEDAAADAPRALAFAPTLHTEGGGLNLRGAF
jgi:serine/threonine-protein kinase